MTLRSELHERELVAVKEGGAAEALRHEAALLADLDHPGVIGFVALVDDERGLRLLTRYAGRETLATWQPPRLEELRRVFEEVAETVCYLHERGILHRDIRPAHVVIDALRRPLLCGFSAARRDAGDDPAAQLADVKAIGETVQATLQRLEAQQRPGRRRHAQLLRRRLEAVAQAAVDGRVPSSRALASRLRAAAGESRSSRPGADRRRDEPPGRAAAIRPRLPARGDGRTAGSLRRRPRRATWLAAATVCAGCVLGVVMVLRLGDGTSAAPTVIASASLSAPSRPAEPAAPEVAAQEAPPSTPPTTRPDPPQRPERPEGPPGPPGSATARCPGPGSGWRDVDGDGCAERIRITAGFVSVDGVRYPVGAPGDQVAVGDWDCDGIATVAIVQPGGRVYLFEGWPQQAPLVGTLVAELPPPVELADVARGACNELTVRYSEGSWHLPLPTAVG
ncbi:MAG: protein kinase [bacterium]|nr:protein kinase [bacterium]